MPRHSLERASVVQVHPETYTKGMPIIVPLVRCIDHVANVLAWDMQGRWTQETQIEKVVGWTRYGVGGTPGDGGVEGILLIVVTCPLRRVYT